jgi:SpoVK/Ycf46/Vps4 family AAA+-type ATPase
MDAMDQLDHYAEVFLSAGTTTFGGISPRTKVLLLGGTGAGKTSVVRKFALRCEWRFVSIDSSAWIPEGSAKPGSLVFIRDFVRSLDTDENAVLMLDEVDKLLPAGDAALDTNWSTSVFGEVLAAIDQDERLLGHNWTMADLEKFRSSIFLVAAGAFEFYLRRAKQKARRRVS